MNWTSCVITFELWPWNVTLTLDLATLSILAANHLIMLNIYESYFKFLQHLMSYVPDLDDPITHSVFDGCIKKKSTNLLNKNIFNCLTDFFWICKMEGYLFGLNGNSYWQQREIAKRRAGFLYVRIQDRFIIEEPIKYASAHKCVEV